MSCNSTKELVKFTPLSVLPYTHALPRRKRGTETDVVKESCEEKEGNYTNNLTRVNPKVSISQFFEHGLIDVISFDTLANNVLSVEQTKDKKNNICCNTTYTSPVKSQKNGYSSRVFRNVVIVNSDNDDNETDNNNNNYNSNLFISSLYNSKDSNACDSDLIYDDKRHNIIAFSDDDDHNDHDHFCIHDDQNAIDDSYDSSRNSSFTLQYINHITNESIIEEIERESQEREYGRVSWRKDENCSSTKMSMTSRSSRGNKSLLKFWDWRTADSCNFDNVTHNLTTNTSLTHIVNVPATLNTTLSMITISNVLRARTASTFTISSTSSAAKRDSDNWESQVEEV